MFTSIYDVRKININSNNQMGGATKPTLNTLLLHFSNSIDINTLIEKEMNIFNSLKSLDSNYELDSNIINVIKDAMDKAIQNEIITNENIPLNDEILKEINKDYNKKYTNVNNNLKKYVSNYLKNINTKNNNDTGRTTRGQTPEAQAEKAREDFKTNIKRFYELIISNLNKKYKGTKKISPDIQFAEPESSGKKISSEGKIISNNLLSTLCRGVLRNTKSQYDKTLVNENKDGFEKMYEKERTLIKNIAITGTTPSNLDSELLSIFNTTLNDNNSGYKNNINNKYKSETASDQLESVYKNKSLYVINNAMTAAGSDGKTRIVNELVSKNNVNTICPISSILDAQGGLGSCTKGKKSQGYISSPIDISIVSDNNNDRFEMSIQLPKAVRGEYVLVYYVMYGGLYVQVQLKAVVTDGILNILSASNTFQSLLNHVELRFIEARANKKSLNWSLFDDKEELVGIISVASKKMMGDFLQELNAIVVNGGFTTNESVYSNNILLTNGDQPSTVRSAYLLLHKGTKGDINKKSAVSFITTSQGYLYHDDNTLALPTVTSSTKGKSKKRIIDNDMNKLPTKSTTIKGGFKSGKTKKYKRKTLKKKKKKRMKGRGKRTIKYRK
jgi:hypothetical protein